MVENGSTASVGALSNAVGSVPTAPTVSTSAGVLRNARPSPAASSSGNPNTQNSASGSRKNSRNRRSVSWKSGCSLIAQMTSRQGDEDVLQGGRMRPQFRELDVSPHELGKQRRHCAVERRYLHPH